MARLTEKQKRFVVEYLVDLNATKAAERAGYSEKTAESQGCRMLKNVKVQAELQKAMQKREHRTEVSADMIVRQLLKIASADIKDFLSFGQKEIPTGDYDGEGNPIYRIINYVDFKNSDDVDGTLIQEVKQGRDGVSIKLMDRMKALELLGRHLGMFTDKIQHSGELEIIVDVIDDEG